VVGIVWAANRDAGPVADLVGLLVAKGLIRTTADIPPMRTKVRHDDQNLTSPP